MTQDHPTAILLPLVVGSIVLVSTILIHAIAVNATVIFMRRQKRLGSIRASFWGSVAIVAIVILFALAAHLTEIALWATLFATCGEFSEFGTAYYHSAVNYTSLGYGDLIMSPKWRLLGPLEAADGLFMFGVSTAVIIVVIQRLLQAKFGDLD
jgi:Ion channel